jgi:hypothetical protein
VTELFIARTDAVVKDPSGTLHRLHRGKTIAEQGHPVVEAAPQAFVPFEIHLPAPDREAADPGHLEDALAEQVAEATAELRAEIDYMVGELTRIRDLLGERDLLPAEQAHRGWLVEAVAAALDRRSAEPEKVAPPRGARKTAVPKAGGSGA